jgi:hypothetical protein
MGTPSRTDILSEKAVMVLSVVRCEAPKTAEGAMTKSGHKMAENMTRRLKM